MSSSPASRPCTAPAQWHVSLGIPRLACLGNVLAAWCVRLCSFVLCVGAMLAAHAGGTHPWLLFAALVSFVTVIKIWPVPEKVTKWRTQINRAQSDRRLSAYEAAKLGGRLSFAAQNISSRLGRAIVRALFQQQYDALPEGICDRR